MSKVVVIYKLKPGATMEQYKKFSRESGAPEKKNPPYQIIEIIDVKDFGEWIKTTQSEGFKKVTDGWAKVGDGGTLVMLGGKKIEK